MEGGEENYLEGNGSGEEEQQQQCLSSYVDQGSVDSHRYFLARRTLLEMLRDRGYNVPSEDIDRFTLDDFRNKYGHNPDPHALQISATHSIHHPDAVLVVFCGPAVVKVNVIRLIAAEITSKDNLTRLIIVLQSPITSQAQKALDLFSFKVELFQITDLLVNITKHVLKPKHRILTEGEKQVLLQKYSLEAKQLPRMLQKDAIARYYGLEKGQVIKVTYSGEITESHVTYRCVW
uniref:Uncharacterized protein n=1 Tax=Kalanchoe fedtschenkoi TaxID=63787 RepID=A0A7N0UP25_KALFE